MAICSNACLASPLTPDQALQRIKSSSLRSKSVKNTETLTLKHTFLTDADIPAVYAFDKKDNKGFILLSADDVAAPVLGYSDSGNFSADEMPPQMEWWLAEYSRQIEYASKKRIGTYSSTHNEGSRAAVAPLLKTRWNQDAPYNAEVPSLNGRNYPTGCVATAMAQVMKYWEYPQRGTGAGTITLPSGATGDASMSLRVAFDWKNMLDTYTAGNYNDTQKNAVARLMKACGYSTKMSYGMGGSGTLSRFAAEALVNNFSYNAGIQYCERNYYSATEWEEMVYTEIAAGRPIMYGGQSSSGGHEFVCDGYAGDGYFHFNWGWGGMSDGYFLLGALDPDAVGIGGGTGNDGFNSNQDIVIGIQPESDDSYVPRITQFGTVMPSVSGNTVTMTLAYSGRQGFWVNADFRAISVDFGVLIENVAQNTSEAVTITSQTISAPKLEPSDKGYQVSYSGFQGNMSFNIPNSLSDGTYMVTVCSRPKNSGSSAWLPVLCAQTDKNYFFLSKLGSVCSIEENVSPAMSINNAEIKGNLYYGCATNISVTVSNPLPDKVTALIQPVLYSGSAMAMVGDVFQISPSAGEKETAELTTVFKLLPGQAAPTKTMSYRLGFVDAESGLGYEWSSSVRMRIGGSSSFKVTELEMEGGSLTGETIGSSQNPNVYEVPSDDRLTLKAGIQNTGVFFGYRIAAQIFEESNRDVVVSTAIFNPALVLENVNDTGVTESVLDTSGLNTNVLYIVKLYAMTPNGFAEIKDAPAVYFRISPSGIEEAVNDRSVLIKFCRSTGIITATGDACSLDIFDLSGMKVASCESAMGDTLSCRIDVGRKGVFIAVARSGSGKTAVLRIVL